MTLSPISSDKATLRRQALAGRDALDPVKRAAAGPALAALVDLFGDVDGQIVSGFVPIRSEIDPLLLMAALESRGAALALPCVVARHEPLMFRAWSPGGQLVPGPMGTREPPADHTMVLPDILLVPLAAFDRRGFRLGYGAGHYDRTIPALREMKPVRLVGLAFAAQEVPAVAQEPHDQRLDLVLTEVGAIVCTG
jgi:5-formyltetrahydrofolate cyclo-ligase